MIVDWETHRFRVRRHITPPNVAIHFTRGGGRNIGVVRERTAYPDFEVVTECGPVNAKSECYFGFSKWARASKRGLACRVG